MAENEFIMWTYGLGLAARVPSSGSSSTITYLSAGLTFTLAPSFGALSSYTRATAATTTGQNGLVRQVRIGELRIPGQRREENLFASASVNSESLAGFTDFSGATRSGNVASLTATVNSRIVSPLIYSTTAIVGRTIRWNATLSGAPGAQCSLVIKDGTTLASTLKTITLTASPVSYSVSRVIAAGAVGFTVEIREAGAAVSVTYREGWVDDVTARPNQNPSEYVSAGVLSTPFHGLNVDGVKLFEAANGNSVDANGVVTFAAGAALPATKGALIEPAATNLIINNNGTWVASGATLAAAGLSPMIVGVPRTSVASAGPTTDTAVSSPITYAAGNVSYVTAYVAAGTSTQAALIARNGTTLLESALIINLTTGAVISQTALAGTIVHTSSVANADGWVVRYSITWAAAGSCTFGAGPNSMTVGALIYLDAMQAEATNYTSLIITAGATASRNADSLLYVWPTGVVNDFSVSFEYTPAVSGTDIRWLCMCYVDESNHLGVFTSGTSMVFRVKIAGVNYESSITFTAAPGVTNSVMATVSSTVGKRITLNGAPGSLNTSTLNAVPGTSLAAGQRNSANYITGQIKSLLVTQL